jgi:hypothetical protein
MMVDEASLVIPGRPRGMYIPFFAARCFSCLGVSSMARMATEAKSCILRKSASIAFVPTKARTRARPTLRW